MGRERGGKEMPYYAVYSGNILRCVHADDALAACVIATEQHIADDSIEDIKPGALYAAAEQGQRDGDTMLILKKHVLAKCGYVVIREG